MSLPTIIENLEKFAKTQPNKVAWSFYNDKLGLEESYTYLVSLFFFTSVYNMVVGFDLNLLCLM